MKGHRLRNKIFMENIVPVFKHEKWHAKEWGYQRVMQCLLPWAEVVMHACITCEQPDGAAPFHSTTSITLSPVSGKNYHCMNQKLSRLIKECLLAWGSGVSYMHPGVDDGWASRSFSLPCFRLAHILRQPSAPIHPMHWIQFSLPWTETPNIVLSWSMVISPFCFSSTPGPLPNSLYGWQVIRRKFCESNWIWCSKFSSIK